LWRSGDAEAAAEIIPKCYAQFGARLGQTEESIATVSSNITAGAATDLSLGDVTTNVLLGTIGVQRYLWPVEHGEQLSLVGIQSPQQAIERNEAGAVAEDAIEARVHLTAPPQGRRRAIRFEIGVELPDQRTDALLRGAVQIGEGVELMDQPLSMDPGSVWKVGV
jgi:hypothetical protein